MSQALATIPTSAEALERVLVAGDLSRLSSEQRVLYVQRVCESIGLNPLTRPFQYLKLSGKEVLYATRDCTEQLRKIHRVGITIVARDRHDDLYVVTARATTPDGRTDESVGAVPLAGKKGEELANAIMKAETKAKRRVTLSICGLGILDESEVDSIQGARPGPVLVSSTPHDPTTGEVLAMPVVGWNDGPPRTIDSVRAELLALAPKLPSDAARAWLTAKMHERRANVAGLEALLEQVEAKLRPAAETPAAPVVTAETVADPPGDEFDPESTALRRHYLDRLQVADSEPIIARVVVEAKERCEAGLLSDADLATVLAAVANARLRVSHARHHGSEREEQ